MNLSDQTVRQGLRAFIQAFSELGIIALVAWVIYLVKSEPAPLEHIALAVVAIIGLYAVGHVAENVTRAVKFKASMIGGIDAEIGADQAAQVVADAAQNQADAVKAGGAP